MPDLFTDELIDAFRQGVSWTPAELPLSDPDRGPALMALVWRDEAGRLLRLEADGTGRDVNGATPPPARVQIAHPAHFHMGTAEEAKRLQEGHEPPFDQLGRSCFRLPWGQTEVSPIDSDWPNTQEEGVAWRLTGRGWTQVEGRTDATFHLPFPLLGGVCAEAVIDRRQGLATVRFLDVAGAALPFKAVDARAVSEAMRDVVGAYVHDQDTAMGPDDLPPPAPVDPSTVGHLRHDPPGVGYHPAERGYRWFGANGQYGPKGLAIYPDPDPLTFESLDGDWARDAGHIWKRASGSRVADPGALRVLNRVYAVTGTVVLAHSFPVKGANPAMFQVLDEGYVHDQGREWPAGYGQDDARVWFTEAAFVPEIKVVPRVKPGELEPLGHLWARTKRAVFHGATRIKADPSTFVALDARHGHDARQAWYHDHDLPDVAPQVFDADVGTLRVLGPLYCVDQRRVYCRGKPLGAPGEGPDPATFVPSGMIWSGTDANGLWHDTERVDRDVPLSITIEDAAFWPAFLDALGAVASLHDRVLSLDELAAAMPLKLEHGIQVKRGKVELAAQSPYSQLEGLSSTHWRLMRDLGMRGLCRWSVSFTVR